MENRVKRPQTGALTSLGSLTWSEAVSCAHAHDGDSSRYDRLKPFGLLIDRVYCMTCIGGGGDRPHSTMVKTTGPETRFCLYMILGRLNYLFACRIDFTNLSRL